MRVAVYCRQPTEPHQAVSVAVAKGARGQGDDAWIFTKDDPQRQDAAECVVIFGIGGDARDIWTANEGKRRILLDKPYSRGIGVAAPTRYHLVRVAIDGFQPLPYFQRRPRPRDRWRALNLEPKPYRIKDGPVLFDGASNKYCLWNDLPAWPIWGQEIVLRISANTGQPIIYRPRPSHNAPPSVKGAELSEGPFADDLARASIVVSHGGNIGFDAALAGVPHFAIADSVARPISETRWERVAWPHVPSKAEREQWFADVAYCQWNLDEFISGEAWRYCREVMDEIELGDHLQTKYPSVDRRP